VDKIRVNTDSLRNTEETVKTKARSINTALIQMSEHVTALNSMWEGAANTAFNSTFQKDITDLQELIRQVESVADYENTAHTEYDKCEKNVSDIINSISV